MPDHLWQAVFASSIYFWFFYFSQVSFILLIIIFFSFLSQFSSVLNFFFNFFTNFSIFSQFNFFFQQVFFPEFVHVRAPNFMSIRLCGNLAAQFACKPGWAREQRAGSTWNFSGNFYFWRESVWALADCEWHTAAPGLKPLRLPHAPECVRKNTKFQNKVSAEKSGRWPGYHDVTLQRWGSSN